jgi:hypothetical protein
MLSTFYVKTFGTIKAGNLLTVEYMLSALTGGPALLC